MREITPEMTQQVLGFLPLLAFGLVLFFTAFVSVVGAGFSLVPAVYHVPTEDEVEAGVEPRPAVRWRVTASLGGMAVLTAVVGFIVLSLLGHGITDLTSQVSQIPVTADPGTTK